MAVIAVAKASGYAVVVPKDSPVAKFSGYAILTQQLERAGSAGISFGASADASAIGGGTIESASGSATVAFDASGVSQAVAQTTGSATVVLDGNASTLETALSDASAALLFDASSAIAGLAQADGSAAITFGAAADSSAITTVDASASVVVDASAATYPAVASASVVIDGVAGAAAVRMVTGSAEITLDVSGAGKGNGVILPPVILVGRKLGDVPGGVHNVDPTGRDAAGRKKKRKPKIIGGSKGTPDKAGERGTADLIDIAPHLKRLARHGDGHDERDDEECMMRILALAA